MASLFQLDGLDRAIGVLSASDQAGFNTMTFDSIKKLNREFAATLVASSMIATLFFIPVLLTVL